MSGPTSHVNPFVDIFVIDNSWYLSNRFPAIKGPLPFRQGVRDPFPPSPHELLELSAHPFVTPVHLQYQTAGRRAITSKEGPEPG